MKNLLLDEDSAEIYGVSVHDLGNLSTNETTSDSAESQKNSSQDENENPNAAANVPQIRQVWTRKNAEVFNPEWLPGATY